MTLTSRSLSRMIGLILIGALLAPSMAIAEPAELAPAVVQAKVQKQGLGAWIGVQLKSGVAFSGKIVSIDEKGFGLQKYGDDKAISVAYADVTHLQRGFNSLRGSKGLTPETVRERIVKCGLRGAVGVQLQNGIAFSGQIVNIDENTFGLQLYGDPEVTPVAYSDVVSLQTISLGSQKKAFWGILAVGAAGMIVLAIVAHHEMDSMKANQPTLPTTTTPVFPY